MIYQSEFSRDWWNRVYGSKPTPNEVVYNGVDLEQFLPGGISDKQNEKLSVMVVEGHIKNGLELGLRNVIRALDMFQSYYGHPVDLHVAGDVPLQVRSELTQGISLPVTWEGILPREVIPARLRKADLFFSAELNPPCPNSVIEALASGLPVAAFERGAIRELVPDDCGIISPYGGNIWNLEDADVVMMAEVYPINWNILGDSGRKARIRAEMRCSDWIRWSKNTCLYYWDEIVDTFSGRLAIQQRVLPFYRAPFFYTLAKGCPGGMELFAGLPRSSEAIETVDHLDVARLIPGENIHLLKGPLYMCLQPGFLHWLEKFQPDVLIVEANPRYLSTPAAVRWMHAAEIR